MQRAARVPSRRLAVLRLAVHAPPSAHKTLDVLRGPCASYGQETLFGLRSSDACHRSNLGVRDLPMGECRRQTGQRSKRTRDPDPFARGARIEADAAEPRGAAEPGVPTFAP